MKAAIRGTDAAKLWARGSEDSWGDPDNFAFVGAEKIESSPFDGPAFSDARCSTEGDPEDFWRIHDVKAVRRAKAICYECPLRTAECRVAIDNYERSRGQKDGRREFEAVVDGQTPRERRDRRKPEDWRAARAS